MFNECHIHLCDCTRLNVFSHAQSLLIKHKKIFDCFSCFWKVFFFLQNVKNSVALFWRLNRGLVLSHVPVASSHRDFSRLTDGSMSLLQKYLEYFSKFGFLTFLATQSGDFFAGGGSSREGYIKIFAVYLATPWRVELPVAKNT